MQLTESLISKTERTDRNLDLECSTTGIGEVLFRMQITRTSKRKWFNIKAANHVIAKAHLSDACLSLAAEEKHRAQH